MPSSEVFLFVAGSCCQIKSPDKHTVPAQHQTADRATNQNESIWQLKGQIFPSEAVGAQKRSFYFTLKLLNTDSSVSVKYSEIHCFPFILTLQSYCIFFLCFDVNANLCCILHMNCYKNKIYYILLLFYCCSCSRSVR